jgi:hypothetical protein
MSNFSQIRPLSCLPAIKCVIKERTSLQEWAVYREAEGKSVLTGGLELWSDEEFDQLAAVLPVFAALDAVQREMEIVGASGIFAALGHMLFVATTVAEQLESIVEGAGIVLKEGIEKRLMKHDMQLQFIVDAALLNPLFDLGKLEALRASFGPLCEFIDKRKKWWRLKSKNSKETAAADRPSSFFVVRVTADNEFDAFRGTPVSDAVAKGAIPVHDAWRKIYREMFPMLATRAYELMAMPASQTVIERVFSLARRLLGFQRGNTGLEWISKRMVLAWNRKMAEETIDEMATEGLFAW